MITDRDTISDLLTKRPGEAIVLAGRYKIVRKLGEGRMGSVWLGEDAKLDGRQVAIKMLPVVGVTNRRAIRQLKDEAEVAMQLSHSNIVTLRSFDVSEEGSFLVMDYVPGKTLEDILAEKGTLTEDEVLKIFKPIAEALDYAHRQKVIHRDIKPSNILIRVDGEPFIMDFGIAPETKDAIKNNAYPGARPYMSPEQLRGEAPMPAQDIYSLAATMYECLSGHPPFHRGNIAHQIEHVEAPPLDRASDLATTLMLALAKEAEGRPKIACELLSPSCEATNIKPPEQIKDAKSKPIELLVGRMKALDPDNPKHLDEWAALAQAWWNSDKPMLARKCSDTMLRLVQNNFDETGGIAAIDFVMGNDFPLSKEMAAPLIEKYENGEGLQSDSFENWIYAASLWSRAGSLPNAARCLLTAEEEACGNERDLRDCDEMWEKIFGEQWDVEKKRFAMRQDILRNDSDKNEDEDEGKHLNGRDDDSEHTSDARIDRVVSITITMLIILLVIFVIHQVYLRLS